ncbi:MAG: twin-arginine translocation signal domain-containing protein [Alphaproteobacteria bacterium]|nr:twin-arginine translocation signal domain-containing protein [Alphaproteobacteria bacterium]
MAQHDLDKVLAQVSQDRRGFLKTLLVGSAVAAVPVMTSQAMAAEGEGEGGEGGEGKKKKKKKKKEGEE